MRYQCIVFDLDGVLVDSWQLMRKAFHTSYRRAMISKKSPHVEGLPRPTALRTGAALSSLSAPIAHFRDVLGKPLAEIARALDLPPTFVSHYRAVSRDNLDLSPPFPGVYGLLDELSRQVPLALNTGKDRERTTEVLRRFELAPYFDAIVAGDDVDRGKPHPESLRVLSRHLQVPCTDMAFVGDSVSDLECARAGGATAIAALWGIEPARRLRTAAPHAEAATIEELRRVLTAPPPPGQPSLPADEVAASTASTERPLDPSSRP